MVINPSIIIVTINLSIILILLTSILFFYKSNITNPNNSFPFSLKIVGINIVNNNSGLTTNTNIGPFIIAILKFLAFLSVFSLITTTYLEFQIINITFYIWIQNTATNISLGFLYDQYFLSFLSVALIVTWSIMEFSYYYMNDDPNTNSFFQLLTIFLLNMLILTCSNSLFLLFLGWEGVGFLSFLLISWWTTRNDANSSALEAIIYNRIGDIGLITFMALSILIFNSWNLSEILNTNNPYSSFTPFILFGLILAAAGKSAQFGLHPWLPAAMEGPTPVSALLHSSTMVVAGVFLLVRTSDLFLTNNTAQTILLLLGGITAIFAASTAIAQHDIKKIIAYSTTSQLGLMVTSIGIGQPLLALFHICTHAFFKAMLFLCSGSIIHSLNNEQDLRKMSGLNHLLPVTSSCLTLGSLALMGTPFLAGFYSKDMILEATSASLLNTLGLSLSLIATLLTATYSFRIIFFCFLSNQSINPLSIINEENHNLTNSLLRLSASTIIAGWLFTNFIFNPPTFTLPLIIKSLPLIATSIGITILLTTLTYLVTTNTNNNTHNTLTSQWFFTEIIHNLTTTMVFGLSLFFSTRTIDQGWQEEIGPQGISTQSINISKINQISQNGLIKKYILSSIALTITIFLISFIVYHN
uniref:NADH dehydrogenase subunit 5 n=1 Tax=Echinocrepis rostrata TaxID=527038 RepID=UPI00292A4792|nr:NADH dehydrogenase subunit 5 [Echinocrepis rostrata]WNL54534.1 NADH dehydrogenase subunit 5 [Echinocrepis rostrata]